MNPITLSTSPKACDTQVEVNQFRDRLVEIKWKSGLTLDAVQKAVSQIEQPEILLWYIGARGLKLKATQFYRNPIGTLLAGNQKSRINLFDMAAWTAFHDSNTPLTNMHRCASMINGWACERLRCICSSDVFHQFQTVNNPDIIRFIQNKVLKRAFIFKPSKDHADHSITLSKVFKDKCPILEPIYHLDTAKAYSPIQYLEGMFLIKQLVEERLKTGSGNINITFVLPNDEGKYYRDEEESFRNDVETLLQLSFEKSLNSKKRKVNIYFYNFKYGSKPNHRPYNTGNETVKTVNFQDVVNLKKGVKMTSPVSPTHVKQPSRAFNMRAQPTAVPGFGDYKPQEQILLDLWKRNLANVYRLNGFNPLDVPPFVRREFLQAKGGINNEIFGVSRLKNDEPTPFGIAFDRTVPFALWVRDHRRELTLPYKRYDINLSFRGEDPQPGRFRGFYQCDVDVVGQKLSLDNDVQCISALVEGLTTLLDSGISNPENRTFNMYLNQISIPKSLFKQAEVPEDKMAEAMRIVDKLDKIGKERMREELEILLAGDVDNSVINNLVEIFAFKGNLADFKIPENFPENAMKGFEDLKTITKSLIANGIPEDTLSFCPGMVRGLNYYTGVVFETFLKALPSAGSVMSGGRYDELVDTFTQNSKGKKQKTGIEGVGGAIGLTRLFDVLSRAELITPTQKSACKVMILAKNKLPVIPWKIAKMMRQHGIPADVYTGNSGAINRQLSYADRNGVPVVVMVMGEKTYCVKKLTADATDEDNQSPDLDNFEAVVRSVQKFLNLE